MRSDEIGSGLLFITKLELSITSRNPYYWISSGATTIFMATQTMPTGQTSSLDTVLTGSFAFDRIARIGTHIVHVELRR